MKASSWGGSSIFTFAVSFLVIPACARFVTERYPPPLCLLLYICFQVAACAFAIVAARGETSSGHLFPCFRGSLFSKQLSPCSLNDFKLHHPFGNHEMIDSIQRQWRAYGVVAHHYRYDGGWQDERSGRSVRHPCPAPDCPCGNRRGCTRPRPSSVRSQ